MPLTDLKKSHALPFSLEQNPTIVPIATKQNK
jgi:hypothetical protein